MSILGKLNQLAAKVAGSSVAEADNVESALGNIVENYSSGGGGGGISLKDLPTIRYSNTYEEVYAVYEQYGFAIFENQLTRLIYEEYEDDGEMFYTVSARINNPVFSSRDGYYNEHNYHFAEYCEVSWRQGTSGFTEQKFNEKTPLDGSCIIHLGITYNKSSNTAIVDSLIGVETASRNSSEQPILVYLDVNRGVSIKTFVAPLFLEKNNSNYYFVIPFVGKKSDSTITDYLIINHTRNSDYTYTNTADCATKEDVASRFTSFI